MNTLILHCARRPYTELGFDKRNHYLAVICEPLFWHEGRVFVYEMNKKKQTVFLEVQLIPDLHKLKSGEMCGQVRRVQTCSDYQVNKL